MTIIEYFLEIIAPHECLGCGAEGSLLCKACTVNLPRAIPQCYRCGATGADARTCLRCRRQTKLAHIYVRTLYEGVAKQMLWRLKFGRARSAGEEIGLMLAPLLHDMPTERLVVVHIPTASSRVRLRGYDQSAVIARQLATELGVPYAPLLVRTGQQKQRGATRAQRKLQLRDAFRVGGLQTALGAHVLLVDDVLTTGATLEAAAETLKAAGAVTVDAAVFARA